MSNKINKPEQWIEQYFAGNADFGRKVLGTIGRNGLGFDQVMFQIILPQLPYDLKYKKFCVYDLIKSIELEIGGNKIIELCSAQLAMLDNDNTKKCATVTNNVILYPFDLKQFFGKSKTTDSNLISVLPTDFQGIRLVDLEMHDVKLYVKFGLIEDMIEKGNWATFNDCKDQLIKDKLQIVDATMLIHYVKIHNENLNCYITKKELKSNIDNETQNSELSSWFVNPLSYFTKANPEPKPSIQVLNIVKNPKLTQDIRTWISDDYLRVPEFAVPISAFKYKLSSLKKESTKIIIHSEKLNKVKYFQLQLDGFDYMDRMEMAHYKKIYEYNNNVTLDDNVFVLDVHIYDNVDYAQINIWFDEPCNDFRIDFMHDECCEGVYENGMFNMS